MSTYEAVCVRCLANKWESIARHRVETRLRALFCPPTAYTIRFVLCRHISYHWDGIPPSSSSSNLLSYDFKPLSKSLNAHRFFYTQVCSIVKTRHRRHAALFIIMNFRDILLSSPFANIPTKLLLRTINHF